MRGCGLRELARIAPDRPGALRTALPLHATVDAAALDGNGLWHTHEWTGAVLPAARLKCDAIAQRAQIDRFLAAALAACRAFLPS